MKKAKNINPELTGRLEAWSYDDLNHVIWGWIFDDKNKRFKDETYIHTSLLTVPEGTEFKEGMEVPTLNSLYLLGKKL
jgi:hypothetical protein